MKLSITQPCKAPWEEMTPVDHGRYCLQCEKQVVDFSGMTDAEVVTYFEKHGKVCGRFMPSQLDREMDIPQKRSFIPAALLAGMLNLLLPEKGAAQRVKVSGYVIDNKGTPISNVLIFMPGTKMGVASQDDGSFYFTTPEGWKNNVTLRFQAIGLEEKEMVFYKATVYKDVCVEMKALPGTLTGEVVITTARPPRWQFWKRLKRK
jgi:hypothetical protein